MEFPVIRFGQYVVIQAERETGIVLDFEVV
jgi:hypothetical protein